MLFAVPDTIYSVPGMLSHEEKRMLYYLAAHEFSGEGNIADMGSYLGGSTICFAAGLAMKEVDTPSIEAYDLFRVDFSRQCAERGHFPDGVAKDERTRPLFEHYLRNYLHLVKIHEGDVLQFSASEPIEILFIDIAKSYKVMDHLLLNFFPALIPRTSLIVMQDYLWGTTGPWHHVVMEKLNRFCEYVVDTNIASVVFSVNEKIPNELLQECLWNNISRDEKLRFMDRAIERLDTENKRLFLQENRRLIVNGRDMTWGHHYHPR